MAETLDALAVEAKGPVTPKNYDDHLTALIANFESAENQTRDARQLSERDKDYYHNDQWTSEELAVLRKRKQPALTINKIKGKIETMRGLERRMRSDPKAFPRNPADEQGAEAATDALRFVGDQNNFDEIRSAVYEDMAVCGFGGVDVTVIETPNDDAKIKIEHAPWERLGYDPHSVKADFSDAKYKFLVIWQDKDDALADHGGRREAVEGTLAYGTGEVYQDTPRDGMWCDSKRTRIRVVQMHYKWDGEWMIATFTRGGFLIDPQVSRYKDKDGNSACSLHMRSMYIDRNGNRYGAVRDLISMQDEFNKRRSKALHLVNSRQTFGNQTAVPDIQKFKTEMAKPDGHAELQGDAQWGAGVGIVPTSDLTSGNIELMQQVAAELQATGANAALAGNDPRGQSGRAQQLQQQAGQITLEPGVDGLRMFSRDVYEAIWMRVKEFWTDEKWVRVTDDERNLKWVGLNKKVTLGDKIKQLPPEEQAQALQQMGVQSPYDPALKEVVDIENDVSGLDVDIVIEEGPDISSLQSEQFETLSGLAKAGIPIPPKAIIQASSIRNKDAILDEMEKGGAPSPQVQKQLADMQEQIKQLSGALENAANEHDEAEKQLADKSASTEIDAYKAETERLKLTAPAMTPEQIQLLVMQSVQEALSMHLGSPPQATPPGLPPPGPPGGFLPPDEAPPGAFSLPVPQDQPPPGFSGVEPSPG